MKITFFPKYDISGASSRYRTFQYLPYFEKYNLKYEVFPFFDYKHIEAINRGKRLSVLRISIYFFKRIFHILSVKKNNLLFIEKELIPYFPPVLEWYLSIRKIKFILDYDDAVIHNYDESPNFIIRSFLSKKIPYIQKKASAVVNGSYYLQNLSLKNNKNSFYIPTSLDINKYKLEKKNINEFIIGWIGSNSTSKLLLPFLNVLEKFCNTHNVKMHLVGFNESLLEKKFSFIKVIPWNKDTETEELCKFSVGISPSVDKPFMRGKCAFKSIQYMACEKPVITTPVGANADVISHGVNGFHTLNNDDWYNYLKILYKNTDLCVKMGVAGRKRVENEFSIQVNYLKYLKLFEKITEQKM